MSSATKEEYLKSKEAALLSSTKTTQYINPLLSKPFVSSPTSTRTQSLVTRISKSSTPGKTEVTRWDGKRLTIDAMKADILSHVKESTSPHTVGFKTTGGKLGVTYEIHPKYTSENEGSGYFRLTAELSVPAALMCALLLDPCKTGYMDTTVASLDFFAKINENTWLAYWCALPPGGLFNLRDGVDLTTYCVDADGTIYQASVSCVEDEVESVPKAVRACDHYFGYRLTPGEGEGTCKATLICQTSCRGSMPTAIVNMACKGVLGAYMRTLEDVAKRMIEKGTAEDFVKLFPGLKYPVAEGEEAI